MYTVVGAGLFLIGMIAGYGFFSGEDPALQSYRQQIAEKEERLEEQSKQINQYRQEIQELQEAYGQLRKTYDRAIRRTAVTELNVEDGDITVVVRTAEGVLETYPTPYDPSDDIYVDYVIKDGRLWIRRVFDDRTSPEDGVRINPPDEEIDWEDEDTIGKAVYRELDEGRWVVTITGDGSLGLVPASEAPDSRLSPPPELEEFEPLDPEEPSSNTGEQ